jgi:two-component system, NarL family, invasion response regulator UvrY
VIRILVVDDHAVVRRGLRQILTDEPDLEVYEAADTHEAMGLTRARALDMVVLDLDLPGKSGFDLLKELKAERPRLPVLILSIHTEDQFALRTLKAGASGFLSKDAAPEDLVKAVRKILRGGKYVSERVADKLLSRLDKPACDAPHDSLSDREFQILRLFGAGKTVREIAEDLSLSVPTISTYRARVLEKLGMKTTAELVHYAILNKLTP